MFLLIKFIRKFFKILNSDAAPWQVFLGATLGLLIGLLPIWPLPQGPAPIGLLVVAAALFINCHLGSVLVFWGIGALLFLALRPLADQWAPTAEGLAAACAEIWFLHASMWSHSGWLVLSLIALVLAPILGFSMAFAAYRFRTIYRPKLLERKRLMASGKAAQKVSNPWLLKIVGWFFGI